MRVRALAVVVLAAAAMTTTLTAHAGPVSVTDEAASSGIAATTNDNYGTPITFTDPDGTRFLVLSNHLNTPAQVYRLDGAAWTLWQTLPLADVHGVAAADWSGDGWPDLFVTVGADRGTSATKSNMLLVQDPAAQQFTLVPGAWGADDPTGRGRTAGAPDYNCDGLPDLFIGNAPKGTYPSPNKQYLNTGTAFTPITPPTTLATGGLFESDTTPTDGCDFFQMFGTSTQARIMHWTAGVQTRIGTVKNSGIITTGRTLDGQFADLNGDGLADVVAVSATQVVAYLATSYGQWSLAWSMPLRFGRNVAVGDADGDGHLDLYLVQGRDTSVKPNVNAPDYLLLGDGSGTTWTPLDVPEAVKGGGSGALFVPYQGGQALVVTNGGDGGATFKGPRQFLTFTPVPPPS